MGFAGADAIADHAGRQAERNAGGEKRARPGESSRVRGPTGLPPSWRAGQVSVSSGASLSSSTTRVRGPKFQTSSTGMALRISCGRRQAAASVSA